MRSFAQQVAILDHAPGALLPALSRIDRAQGQEAMHRAQVPNLLERLAQNSRVRSVKTSSALEGVIVADDRRADRVIASTTTTLRNRVEFELAGYRDALDHVWENDWRPLNTGLILLLHRSLLQRSSGSGGVLKTDDDLVVDRLADGERRIRFRPVSARETPWFLEQPLDCYRSEAERERHHPLLLVGLLVLHLFVIHPFDGGDGRVARVLTDALLADAGDEVARCGSVEQVIAESSEAYYASLLDSTHGWHDGGHDPWPWLSYFTGVVARCCVLFAERTASGAGGGGKRERVERFAEEQAPASFRVSDVRSALPGISDGIIRNALDDLRREGRVDVDGMGRGATWTRL